MSYHEIGRGARPAPVGMALPASEIEENYTIAFWDAMIVSAAYSKNAAVLLTEDLNDGQQIEGITIVNPLKPT